jgi:hypothetical protein
MMVTKEKVLNKVSAIDDDSLMLELYCLLDFYENNDEVFIFSKEEEVLIHQSLEEVKQAKVTQHEDLVKMSEKWLRE